MVYLIVMNLSDGQEISLIDKEKDYKELTAVSYSSELKPEILEIHKKYKITSHQKMKSSLKFCVSCCR